MPDTNTFKIALGQIPVRAGRPDLNFQTMLDYCRSAHAQGADLLVFPELAVSGSFLGQGWAQPGLLHECQKYNQKLIAATASLGDMGVVFGSIGLVKQPGGQESPASAIYVAQAGRQLSSPAGSFSLKVNKRRLDFALLTEQQPQPTAPIVLKLATSFYVQDRYPQFMQSLAAYAQTYRKTLVYVNHVGVQDAGKPAYVYDGGSAVLLHDGSAQAAAARFAPELLVCEVSLENSAPPCTTNAQEPPNFPPEDTEILYQAVVSGLRQYAANLELERFVVGLSGGIDSAVCACLLVAAFGADHVLALNMPSQYNCDATREIAAKLAANLHIRYEILDIDEAVAHKARQFEGINLPLSQSALENVQARERGAGLLAAAAAAFNGAVCCCGNKSEFTVGYATMYGDATGFLAPIGDLWKCQVYELASYIYKTTKVIPPAVLEIRPSAELSPAQSIEAGLGDPLTYAYHDYLFRSWVEWGQDISDTLTYYNDGRLPEVIGCGAEELRRLFPTPQAFVEDLERWWAAYRGLAVAKRLQAPPVLSLSRRAFGSDLPESQTGCWLDGEYRLQKARFLAKADHIAQ